VDPTRQGDLCIPGADHRICRAAVRINARPYFVQLAPRRRDQADAPAACSKSAIDRETEGGWCFGGGPLSHAPLRDGHQRVQVVHFTRRRYGLCASVAGSYRTDYHISGIIALSRMTNRLLSDGDHGSVAPRAGCPQCHPERTRLNTHGKHTLAMCHCVGMIVNAPTRPRFRNSPQKTIKIMF